MCGLSRGPIRKNIFAGSFFNFIFSLRKVEKGLCRKIHLQDPILALFSHSEKSNGVYTEKYIYKTPVFSICGVSSVGFSVQTPKTCFSLFFMQFLGYFMGIFSHRPLKIPGSYPTIFASRGPSLILASTSTACPQNISSSS